MSRAAILVVFLVVIYFVMQSSEDSTNEGCSLNCLNNSVCSGSGESAICICDGEENKKKTRKKNREKHRAKKKRG